jgi:subtilisin family serine protease
MLPAYSPDELLIKFRNGVGSSAIRDSLTEVQGTVVGYLGNEISPAQMVFEDRAQRSFVGDPDLFLIRMPEIVDMDLVICRLRANVGIEYVERNLYFRNCSIDDPLYADQWALDKIQAPEAWDLSTGSSDIIVAIIDSGIQNDHPDLQDHLWHNPGETENGDDDDDNSYPDDLHGWHWGYSADDNSTENWNGDSHATQIAGIIGASWNTIGIRGINENVKIMSLNVQGYRPEVALSDIIRAIDYANDNGAAVISFSMASPEYDSQALESAIIRAQERGLLFVCGIGNYKSGSTGWYDVDDQESHHMYPGCFPEDNIISVLATDSSDDIGSDSMYGEYFRRCGRLRRDDQEHDSWQFL